MAESAVVNFSFTCLFDSSTIIVLSFFFIHINGDALPKSFDIVSRILEIILFIFK